MRFHEKLLVTAAVVFATAAVGANVFAITAASGERARLSTTTMTFAPIPSHVAADVPSADPATSEGPTSTTPCEHVGACPDGPPVKEITNHGRMVRAFILEMGYDEGVDGPLGAIIRTIARPDANSDEPPRSDRAQENLDNKKPKTPKDPPGRSRDD